MSEMKITEKKNKFCESPLSADSNIIVLFIYWPWLSDCNVFFLFPFLRYFLWHFNALNVHVYTFLYKN